MKRHTDADVVAAVRLALEASADARALRAVLREIVARAEMSDPATTAPVSLLLDAIRASNTELVVTDHYPRGRVRRARQTVASSESEPS